MLDFLINNQDLFVRWMLIFVGIVLLLFLFSSIYFYLLRKDFVDRLRYIKKPLTFFSLFAIWLSGLILYTLGFYRDGLNFVSVVPNAVVAAFKMFLMQNQLGRVDFFLREDAFYMTCFSLTHFVAVLMSVMFVMRLIGFRVKMAMSFYVCAHFRILRDKTVNIFWGMNEAAYLLAESIHREKKKKNEYIFINTSNDDYKESKISLSSLFDVVNLDNAEIRRLGNIRAYVINGYDDIVTMAPSRSSLFRKLRLSLLAKIIRRAKQSRIFLLSSDENYNVNAALKLMKDRDVAQNEVTIYVHAFGEKMNEIYNHYSMYSGETTKLKVVDSSYLSVTKLKQEPAYHPVNFVSLDEETATVSSKSFNALVLGMGETAIESFQFLYEFASFVDAEGNKIPFHCDMMAKDIHQISEALRTRMPAIKEDELSFHAAAIDSKAYWDLLNEKLPVLNYVVIAVNDDEMAMYAALEIYKRAMQLRDNCLDNFGIFVRCSQEQDYQRMLDLSKRMNENNKDSHAKIVIFGLPKELYTYDLVIRESLLKQAMNFHKSYDNINGDISVSAEEHWLQSFGQKNIEHKLESVLHKEPHCSKLQIIQDFLRQKEQNMSNSQHMATKYILLGINKHNIAQYQAAVKTRLPEKIAYRSGDAKMDVKLLNLSKCEHIRWESSHKLLGYVRGEKSLIKKQHPCLVPWDDLSELLQSYDCNVVDTSIKMYENK